MVGGRYGQDIVDEPVLLAVPSAEAEDVLAEVDRVVGWLDELILTRDGQRGAKLELWEGPARLAWDDEFQYAQLDVQAVIDALQAYKAAINGIIETIDGHNQSVIGLMEAADGSGQMIPRGAS